MTFQDIQQALFTSELEVKWNMHPHSTILDSAFATQQSRAGWSAGRECHGSQRAECPIFLSQLWNCKIWNENSRVLHQYSAIMGYREIAHATRQSIFLSLATSQMTSQRHNRESQKKGTKTSTLSKHKGREVHYCLWLPQKAIMTIMAIIQWNIFDLFINKKSERKRKNMEVDRAHEYSAESLTFHGSSKIIHQSIMKSRLDQQLGEMWNGAELSIWKQQRIVPSRCSA